MEYCKDLLKLDVRKSRPNSLQNVHEAGPLGKSGKILSAVYLSPIKSCFVLLILQQSPIFTSTVIMWSSPFCDRAQKKNENNRDYLGHPSFFKLQTWFFNLYFGGNKISSPTTGSWNFQVVDLWSCEDKVKTDICLGCIVRLVSVDLDLQKSYVKVPVEHKQGQCVQKRPTFPLENVLLLRIFSYLCILNLW